MCAQVQLYEDFAKSHAKKKVEEELVEGEGEEEGEGEPDAPVTHIFQVGVDLVEKRLVHIHCL